MARRLYSVSNLVAEVRSMLDESNTDSVEDGRDILPALNRGLDYAGSILSRKYPDPFVKSASIDTISGTATYEIPEDCFEDRILRVEVNTSNGVYQELRRISFYDVGQLQQATSVQIPQFYAITGRDILLVPGTTGTYDLRIWYFRQPEELVLPQGRITSINTGSGYVLVDEIGDALDTESDTLESYINFVDGQTGRIKGSAQIQSTDTNGRITIRPVPIRTDALNRTVTGTLPADLNFDDYVCYAGGTCVPEFSQPLSNFLIQFTVAEITRKLGGDAPSEEQVLQKFEKQLSGTWAGRENTARIKRRSSAWGYSNNRSRYPIRMN